MESRTFTKSFGQILSNILLNQQGLSKENLLTNRCFISTYKYNSNPHGLDAIRPFLSVNHCSPEVNLHRYFVSNTSSKRNYSIFNPLFSSEPLAQVPVAIYTRKSDIQPILHDGIGWAGQPIVKRIHPILPEVYGDIPDFFNTVENQQPTHSNNQSAMTAKGEQSTGSDTSELTLQTVGEKLINEVLQSNGLEKVKTIVQKYNESLSTKLEKGQDIFTNSIVQIQNAIISKNIKTPLLNHILPAKLNNKSTVMLKKEDDALKQGIACKRLKIKKRKRIKVCDSKSKFNLQGGSLMSVHSKMSENQPFFVKRKSKIDTSILNPSRTEIHNLSINNNIRMQRQQFSTGFTLYRPRSAQKVTEKSSELNDRKQSQRKNKVNSENKAFDDDCTCPEQFVVKSKRIKTKICGKAAGSEEKKEIKKWKPKMCLLETPVKYRNRTFVCASKVHEKGKKGRQLPKCVKPEKMIAPRVIICPPNLINELEKKSKKCEKPIEEERIRKRTKVCKPVLLYAKEITEVKVEKTACVNVKKTKSRHTQICPPHKEKGRQQMHLQN